LAGRKLKFYPQTYSSNLNELSFIRFFGRKHLPNPSCSTYLEKGGSLMIALVTLRKQEIPQLLSQVLAEASGHWLTPHTGNFR
jgi:hypothetical protein